ncbi:hypothetical protein W04_3563 [Pseudoalteromonas sp. SW0106-04]|uniref:gpW family head-tail joining protein n=1 Tax=Pseudoalteromonas sp. SW0106-04 TaxID=1702169 RepID=UPI0006B46837|nr:gpW family head-tail joining protein [Pseudoalteromonas sp. SW0106-04]GAP76984.1 hypothetical protein W04_3563 [Pseudoalteromonas sp. SW0106-04]
MSKEILAIQLQEAKDAYHALMTGQQVVSFARNGRQTQFSQANKQELKSYIMELEREIHGNTSRRRGPMGVILER